MQQYNLKVEILLVANANETMQSRSYINTSRGLFGGVSV